MLRIIFSAGKPDLRGPAIFIDRDGVINCRRPGDYVLHWSQFLFVPGIQAALRQLATLGLPMIVISNQAAVGKGLLDASVLQEITAQMHQTLLGDGVSFAAAYYCPHRADENCDCRKPKPGMLHRSAEDLNIDLGRSIFVGDSMTDMQAGQEAGCQPIAFGPSLCELPDSSPLRGSFPIARAAEDLFDVAVKCLHDRGHGTTDADTAHALR
jgi:histidinol-phosphate phosphatase family protein